MQYFGMELSRKISPNHYLTRPTTPLYNKPPLPINCLNLSLDTIPSLSLLSTGSLIQFTHRNPHIKKPRNQTKGAPEALGEGKKKHQRQPQQTHKIYIYIYIYQAFQEDQRESAMAGERTLLLGLYYSCVIVSSMMFLSSNAQTCSNYRFTSNQAFNSCTDLPYLNAFLHWNYDTSTGTSLAPAIHFDQPLVHYTSFDVDHRFF